ncbi:acyl-CoA dehydrogenase [Mycobacterium bohemicum DSM 44277]|uniref:Acyl-CoA dehydrogenase n=1 Tax=Mycobacterium bohemicum DSM 44277 TaxID=1236609 RepID=A0A0U0W2L3_MYCBE|nr:acyl-CoA dehydrogenase [Mycobacterium bohemicum DSM 44277]
MREYSVPAHFTVGEHDSVAAMVYAHEREDPGYPIYRRLVDGAWTDVTCAEAASQIRSAALGLISMGAQAGDRVSIFSATRYEWAILDLAILSVGAVTVPIYETSSAEQVRWVLQDSEAVLAFAETDAQAAMVTELTAELPALRRVLHIDGSGPKALDQLMEAGATVDPAELTGRLEALRAEHPATLIYTSGTTGRPKGCQLTHSNLLYEIRGTKECLPTLLDEGQRLLVFLPLAHVLARALTLGAFANKVTVGFTSDIKNLLPILAVFKPTVVVSVPRVFEKVYNTAEQNAANDGKGRIFTLAAQTAVQWSQAYEHGKPGPLLRARHALFDRLVYKRLRAALGGECRASVSGGAPLGARLGHFYRGAGVTIHEGYGLTETSAAITVNQVGHVRIGTVGTLVPGNSIRIGQDGELLLRGGVVFTGYWHNEQATAEAFSDGCPGSARAVRCWGVRATYCDLTTAICTCSWLCLACSAARTAAACSAAVLASAADLADSRSAWAACSPANRKLVICLDICVAITRCTASWSISPWGEPAVRMACIPSTLPPM